MSPAAHRPAWSGNLKLSLVTVPVVLIPATASGARLSFHQIHEPSGRRIRYEKVVPGIGPVDADEIIKGYEIEKGRYVLLTDEEIDDIKIEASRTLELVQFVDVCEIEPIWFNRPYYVIPGGEEAEEAYGVLREALRQSRKMGLGQFVLRGREYVAALKPCGNGLMVETLHFPDEVRRAASYFARVDRAKPDEELLEMAELLIEKKSEPFNPDRFKDRYSDTLRDLIDKKARSGKPISVEEPDATRGAGSAEVIDLVAALKKSVENAGGGGRKRRKAS